MAGKIVLAILPLFSGLQVTGDVFKKGYGISGFYDQDPNNLYGRNYWNDERSGNRRTSAI